MKKFAQILNNKAHYIFEAEEKPVFHPSIVIVDITGNNNVQEGWNYNTETGEFSESTYKPEVPEPVETIEEKLARMEQQLEEQSIVQLEVLATIYEELLMKG